MGPSREINGPRPARLKIHKDSHLINKPSSTSSSSTNQPQRHQPVIIYTHSPKVIHTHARDFMALVQKLTGLSHSDDEEDHPAMPPKNASLTTHSSSNDNNNVIARAVVHDNSSSSSENCAVANTQVGCSSLSSSSASPMIFEPPLMNPYLPEMPFFMPNSSDYFCTPRPFYRYPEASEISPPIPNICNSIPPSVMDIFPNF